MSPAVFPPLGMVHVADLANCCVLGRGDGRAHGDVRVVAMSLIAVLELAIEKVVAPIYT